MATQQGTGAWSAPSAMRVSPVLTLGLASLWIIYANAADTYETLLKRWRWVAPVARADGSAGYLYTQLYIAEMAKDSAFTAWDAARKAIWPAPRTN